MQPFEFDPGEIGAEEVEIKVSHCGICHSDLSMLDNEWGDSAYPFVPGHEAVGTVVALGEGAKGLEIGQRVGVGWSAYSYLSCQACLAGDHNLCARHAIAPVTEMFPISQVNDAFEHLRSGKARYRTRPGQQAGVKEMRLELCGACDKAASA